MIILVADDEEYALKQLVHKIEKVKPEAEVHGFMDPQEVIDYGESHSFDIAFLDIDMGYMDGMEVAKKLKLLKPHSNIVFVTAYNQYMEQAFKLRVSGYLMKPADEEDIREELDNLRIPVMPAAQHQLVARCFGNFEVFVDGNILNFERSKTKELLAYLIDRNGSSVSSGDLRAVLWEYADTDEKTGNYLQKLKQDLISSLKRAGVESVFRYSWNKYSIDPEKIACDYFDFMNNHPEGIKAYNGEYMNQYEWGMLRKFK